MSTSHVDTRPGVAEVHGNIDSRAKSQLPPDAARVVVLAVVADLAPEEMVIAEYFVDPLIEMSESQELSTVDPRDAGGGFGSSDPLFLTVVPVVVELVQALRQGEQPERLWRDLGAAIVRVAEAVKSQHAQRRAGDLQAAIRRAFQALATP